MSAVFGSGVLGGCAKAPTIHPEELFKRYIIDPIPETVTNIRADQPKRLWGYRYTFRFNIAREDVAKIVDSRPFKQISNANYKDNGHLEWEWDASRWGEVIVYHPRSDHARPEWFTLGLWDNPEAYAFVATREHDHKDTWVLLYNEKDGEAYFIIDSR
jgi:hypothetical protein